MSEVDSSISYDGHQAVDVVIRPAINYAFPEGITTIDTKGAAQYTETYYTDSNPYLLKYTAGFQGGDAVSEKKKTFKIGEVKREWEGKKNDFSTRVQRESEAVKSAFMESYHQESLRAVLSDENTKRLNQVMSTPAENRTPSDLDFLKDVELVAAENWIFMDLLQKGMSTLYWFGDENWRLLSETTFPGDSSATPVYGADRRVNGTNGIWKWIFDQAATTVTDSHSEIQKVEMDNSAVAQVYTITFTGTGGTATVSAFGIDKTATFVTDLATTAENFATENASAYPYHTISNSGATVILTSKLKGVDFSTAPTVTNLTDDLTGTAAETTSETAAGDMSSGEARTKMASMISNAGAVLREMVDDAQNVPMAQRPTFYVSSTWYQNYKETLGFGGSGTSTDLALQRIAEGVGAGIEYNGCPVKKVPYWSDVLNNIFGGYSPHRAILTIPSNLAIAVNTASNATQIAKWYDIKYNADYARVQTQIGTGIIFNELAVAAFQSV